jgi:stearoyl-CoA desaturase (delta-9 desaturase)
VLWWAAKHRWHHKHSDTELDVHSPRQRGFLYAHLGWIFTPSHHETDYGAVPDLAKFPELVWLDRHPYLPAALLGLAAWLIAGWSGLVVGFFWSTVAVWHATFSINSLAHVSGRRRYVTGDDSRNNELRVFVSRSRHENPVERMRWGRALVLRAETYRGFSPLGSKWRNADRCRR